MNSFSLLVNRSITLKKASRMSLRAAKPAAMQERMLANRKELCTQVFVQPAAARQECLSSQRMADLFIAANAILNSIRTNFVQKRSTATALSLWLGFFYGDILSLMIQTEETMLDNRLKACADFVSGKGIVCDVGTDHAYLAAELINSGKCSRVIASDIKEGPLDSAKKTVEKYNISDKVELVLSDGLSGICLDGVTDIIIAGMGGETISDIIADVSLNRYDETVVRWILQPMTKPEYLRKKLYELKKYIVEERVVEDNGKLYVVMCAEYSPDYRSLTEFDALYGFFDESDPMTVKYREHEAERLEKKAQGLESAGRFDEVVHCSALSYKIKNGVEAVQISEIYNYLDQLYPFAAQEKWDNSGLLVENNSEWCDTVVLTLDITNRVICEAEEKLADLIISHHPVIFDPLKRIAFNSPVYNLIKADISAICAHTNLDIAAGGTNGVILKKLKERFKIENDPEPFEELGGGENLGWIVELPERVRKEEFAADLKEIFGCEYVRITAHARHFVKRIAFCSGSGGSMLGLAAEKGCDALITGDVKHDVWIDGNNRNIAIFDCGHFHTENIVLWELRRTLEEKYPQLDIEIAEKSQDPCRYI